MKLKDYLISIEEDYAEFESLTRTPYYRWTQEQKLLANMLESAMREKLIPKVSLQNLPKEAA